MDEWINEHEIVRQGTDEGGHCIDTETVRTAFHICVCMAPAEMKNLQEKDAKEKEKQRRATASKNSSANASASTVGAATVGDAPVDADSAGGAAPRNTRAQKRKAPSTDDHEFAPPDEHDEHEGMDAASIREHEEVTKVKVGGLFVCVIVWVSEGMY